MDKVIYFAHGKESGPWGTKIEALAKIARDKGFRVESPDYSFTMDPEERVKKLLSLSPQAEQLVLVGSSMGGYVSAVASVSLKVSGLFLLAPAFYIPGYKEESPKPHAEHTMVVHGWNDELIPYQNAVNYAAQHKTDLYLLNSDHRLMSGLETIEKIFAVFLDRLS